MIIKSKPISSKSGSGPIWNHLANKLEENEYIDVLKGSKQDIDNCVSDSKSMNRKNSVIHFMFSSDEKLSDEQSKDLISKLGKEFGFSEDDIQVIAEHGKERHNNGEADGRHWHFLVRANNPETGKTLNLSNAYKRQELVSRTFEIENSLKLNQGRHNKYVYHNIDEKYKDLILPLCKGDLPNSFTNDNSAQQAKRDGRDLFSLKDEAKNIFNESFSWNDFQDKIQARGWTIEQGTKKPDVLILNDENGKLIGSVSRVLGLKKDELNKIIDTPDSIIASRVVGGTFAPTLNAGEGQAPSTPQKPTENQPDQKRAQETHSGGHIHTDAGNDSTQTTESMSADEKQSIQSQNSDKAQARKTMQESLSSQERMALALEKLLEKQKKPQKTWDQTLDENEQKLIKIINQRHPKLKEITDKQVKDWIYKNHSEDLNNIKTRRININKLGNEIKQLRKSGERRFDFWSDGKADRKVDKYNKDLDELQLLITHMIHCILYKLGLTKTKPNSFNLLTEEQKKQYLIDYKTNKLTQMMTTQKQSIKAIDRIALLKMTENNEKIREFQERPEVQNSRKLLMKLNNLRQVDINDLDEIGQNEFKDAMKNMNIDGAMQAVRQSEKRQELVEISQFQAIQPEYSGNVVKFQNKKKVRNYSRSL